MLRSSAGSALCLPGRDLPHSVHGLMLTSSLWSSSGPTSHTSRGHVGKHDGAQTAGQGLGFRI